MSKKWIGVVSKSHVSKGINGGFACVCHGKKGPISRLKQGDWLIYYSPTNTYPNGKKCQEFTGIGRVISGQVHEIDLGMEFTPHGIDMEYLLSITPVSVHELKKELSFTQSRSWGMLLRSGLFQISDEDFNIIKNALQTVKT